MTFTVSLYRQVVIGIAKKHLYLNPKLFLREYPSEGAIHKLFAWQAGHSVAQEMESYGLDGNYPTRLQPLLFDLYRLVSQAWHEWLGLSDLLSLGEDGLNSSKKRKRGKEDEEGNKRTRKG